MPKHGLIILYVHGNQKARSDGQPRTATSTLTQLLNYESVHRDPTDYYRDWEPGTATSSASVPSGAEYDVRPTMPSREQRGYHFFFILVGTIIIHSTGIFIDV